VAVEAPAGSQHAVSAKALALVYGAVRGVLRAHDYVPLLVQAYEAKEAATGLRNASKQQVIDAMSERFGRDADIRGSKVVQEAKADALSVACAAMQSTVVATMRRST
jgi:Holliday junction resolvasome RuvABC endonuclease subunit